MPSCSELVMHCKCAAHCTPACPDNINRTAYRSGVTLATSSLTKSPYIDDLRTPVISGLSVTFRTGAAHALERGAIIQDVAALHVNIARVHPFNGRGISVSTQIAGLRRLLSGWESTEKETGRWFRKAAEARFPNYCDK